MQRTLKLDKLPEGENYIRPLKFHVCPFAVGMCTSVLVRSEQKRENLFSLYRFAFLRSTQCTTLEASKN